MKSNWLKLSDKYESLVNLDHIFLIWPPKEDNTKTSAFIKIHKITGSADDLFKFYYISYGTAKSDYDLMLRILGKIE